MYAKENPSAATMFRLTKYHLPEIEFAILYKSDIENLKGCRHINYSLSINAIIHDLINLAYIRIVITNGFTNWNDP
jgi:hypothetical protein